MNESGRGGSNRRRPFKRKDKDSEKWGKDWRRSQEKPRFDKSKGTLVDRPQWTAPKLGGMPLPKPECAYCGKPIQDIAAAINDPASGQAVHFDCVRERIAASEPLGEGDTVTYIGGGRFGIVNIPNPNDPKRFQIKKILQWEPKDQRAAWRKVVADNYSST